MASAISLSKKHIKSLMELVITVTFSAAPEQSSDVIENFQGSKLKAFQ